MAAAAYFDTVQKIFIAFYQRPADPAGLKYWADRIDAANGDAAAVVSAFATSPEAVTLYGTIDATTIGAVIDKIYLALFNTAPDAAGKKFYVDGFTAGTFTAGTIALNILNGATNDDAVAIANKLQVSNTFTQQVDGRALTSPYFGTGTSFSATYKGDADAQAARDILKTVTASPSTVLSPSQVTVEIQTKIADAGDPIVGQTSGQTFTLTNVVDNFVGTAGNDTFTGGTAQIQAADTINGAGGTDTAKLYLDTAGAGLNASNVEIFQIQSSLGGGAAFNATNVTGAQEIWSAGSTSALTVNGLKNNVTLGLDKTQQALNANFVAGVLGAAETLKLATDASGTATAFVNVRVDDGGAASKFTTLDVAATAGKSYITIDDSAAGNSTTDFTTIKTSGAGFVSLSTLSTTGAVEPFANVTTVQMDAAGGSVVNLAASGNAKAVKVTGGEGNDTVIFAAAQFNTQDVIDLGAGTNTLVLGDANLTGDATTELTKAINAAKGVTTLATSFTTATVGGVDINAARYSAIDAFATTASIVRGTAAADGANGAAGTAGGAAVAMTGLAASGDSLNVQNNLTGQAAGAGNGNGNGGAGGAALSLRMALDSGADTFSLSVTENNTILQGGKGGALAGNGAHGAAGIGLDAREIESLSISVSKNLQVVSGTDGGNAAAAADTLVGANATVTITGNGDVNLGNVRANANDTAFQNLTIKAGDLVGALTLTTGAGNDVITVGSKGSTVAAGDGTDTITLGAGVDTVQFLVATNSGNVAGGVITTIDTVVGFKAGLGGDVLDFTGVGAGFFNLTSANRDAIKNSADLKAAADAAANFVTTNTTWAAFEYSGKTYAIYETTGANTTYDGSGLLVELVGVTATDLVATNLI